MTLSLQYVFATRNAGIWAVMGVVAQTFVCARLEMKYLLSGPASFRYAIVVSTSQTFLEALMY
jgi:hypothetical protein